jgi:hypothetical protein
MRWLLVVLVLLVAALVPVTGASAQPHAPPILASGTFQQVGPPAVLASETVGGITLITQRAQFRLTGTLSGTAVGEQRLTIFPNGTVLGVAEETFTGTVAGRAGTLQLRTFFTVEGTTIRGQIAILGGTGGLRTVRGPLRAEGSAQTGSGTYTGLLVVGP